MKNTFQTAVKNYFFVAIEPIIKTMCNYYTTQH